MEEDIVVNVDFEWNTDNPANQNEIQVVPCNIAWEDFELMLKVYCDKDNITVYYIDDDDDLVTISSEDELREAFKVAKKCNRTLHLKVFCDVASMPKTESIQEDGMLVKANVMSQSVTMEKIHKEDVDDKASEKDEEEQFADAEDGNAGENIKDDKKEEAASSSSAEEKKYFFIRNKKLNQVLDIRGANKQPGSDVIVFPRKPVSYGAENQQWYLDSDRTLRSKLNNFYLHVNPFKSSVESKKPMDAICAGWGLQDNKLVYEVNPSIHMVPDLMPTFRGSWVKMMDIPELDMEKLGFWEAEYIDEEKQVFYLVNKKLDLVLDVSGGNPRPRTPVIMWVRKEEQSSNQLWYWDAHTRTIRSKLGDMLLNITAVGSWMRRPRAEGDEGVMWMVDPITQHLVHQTNPNQRIVASPMVKPTGSKVVLVPALDGNNPYSEWEVDFVDTLPSKTCTNKETGEDCVPSQPSKKLKMSFNNDMPGARPKELDESQPPIPRPRFRFHRHPQERKVLHWVAAEMGRQGLNGSEPFVNPDEDRKESRLKYGKVPSWFSAYMEKFKRELSTEVSHIVAKKTVNKVLRGLHTEYQEEKKLDQRPMIASKQSHEYVICDNCENPIVGNRFKCGNCADYDLCEVCEDLEGVHEPNHIFLKIRRPLAHTTSKRSGKGVPMLKYSLYDDVDVNKEETHSERKIRKLQEKLARKEDKFQQKIKRLEEKNKHLEDHFDDQRERQLAKKQHQKHPEPLIKTSLGGDFVHDESIPDGTRVQPGTRLTKKWLMQNSGSQTWTADTKLQMMWGNMCPVEPEVVVPCLTPGEEGIITVELIAPQDPGVYQSHWRLVHQGYKFGHRVWSSITVDPKETLEVECTQSPNIDLNMLSLEPAKEYKDKNIEVTEVSEEEQLHLPSPASAKSDVDKDLLSAKDLLSFEMLDIRDRSKPKMSQTATPNNTPIVVSPPKSPVPPEMQPEIPEYEEYQNEEDDSNSENEPLGRHLSCSSSVEIVGEAPAEISMEDSLLMTDLVQERMASLGLRLDHDDLESWSSCCESLTDETDDDDFYIVPIPDCFNPRLPLSKVASTTLYVKKEGACSVDEMLTASQGLDTEPLLKPTTPVLDAADDINICDEDMANNDDVIIVKVELPPETDAVSAEPEAAMIADGIEVEAAQVEPTDSAKEATEYQDESDMAAGEDTAHTQIEETVTNTQCDTIEREHSPSQLAGQWVSVALGVATHTARTAMSTAKDVFNTLQAKSLTESSQPGWLPSGNQWNPPQEGWTPSQAGWSPAENKWTPPANDWKPPGSDWTPPCSDWSPPEETPAPVRTQPQQPEDVLVEMGFADRNKNRRLLEKYDDDIDRVLQELIENSNNNWQSTRH